MTSLEPGILGGFHPSFVVAVMMLGACGSASTLPGRDGGDVDASGWDAGASDEDNGADTPLPGGYTLPEFPGGVSFYLRLPPAFSPFLPLSGDEATREPPGFHDQGSEHYFSYGFIWWLTGTPDLSTTALRADLRNYYIGLCPSTTVVVTLVDPDAGSLDGGATQGGPDAGTLVARRSGSLDAGTCFGKPVPVATVEVSTYRCSDHTAVIVLVSPQPSSGQVWTDLRNIRDGFVCW